MFGQNEIVGLKYFKEADEDKLFVTSMFMTLQGEGPYRGEPAFFIRLAKCNLNCSFCDTFFDDGDWLTFDQIEEKIETTIDNFYKDLNKDRPNWTKNDFGNGFEHGNNGIFQTEGPSWNRKSTPITEEELRILKIRNMTLKKMVLVITGGEPMLQQNLGPFLERMQDIFEKTQIESNGTLVQDIPYSTTLVVSPKCAEKNGIAIKYLTPKQEMLDRANCLKFVMNSDETSPYNIVPEWAHKWREETGKPIYVSPMNIYNEIPQKSKQLRAETNQIDMETRSTVDEVISFWSPGLLNMSENQKNHEYAARYCVEHGFILNLQIHLYASLA